MGSCLEVIWINKIGEHILEPGSKCSSRKLTLKFDFKICSFSACCERFHKVWDSQLDSKPDTCMGKCTLITLGLNGDVSFVVAD